MIPPLGRRESCSSKALGDVRHRRSEASQWEQTNAIEIHFNRVMHHVKKNSSKKLQETHTNFRRQHNSVSIFEKHTTNTFDVQTKPALRLSVRVQKRRLHFSSKAAKSLSRFIGAIGDREICADVYR